MNYRVFAALSSLTLLTSAGAFAQSGLMLADIPFEFRAGATILPAGRYDVHPQVAPGVLSIRCARCNAGVMIQTDAVGGGKAPTEGKLVFNRYGRTYFLSAVWTPGYSQGRMLHPSRAERELARNGSTVPPVAVALVRH